MRQSARFAVGNIAYVRIRQMALLHLQRFSYTGGIGAKNMNQATRITTLNLECESVISQMARPLTQWGLRIVRSFDLQSACASFPDLTCPHHGDTPCDCQLVVLLIYGADAHPASVVLHSHRGKTDIDLVDSPNNRPTPDLVEMIRQVFSNGFEVPLHQNEWADVT
jgi:hypothetical protein